MKHEDINQREHSKRELPVKLNREEILEILKKFNDVRINTDEHLEYFSIHLKNGKIIRIPKWRYILYANGTKIDIEDEIKNTLNS